MKNETRKTKSHKTRIGAFAVSLVMVAVLATGLLWPATEAQGATAYTGYVAGIEQQATAYTMLGKVNAARQTASVGALKWDTALENAAIVRAKEVAVYFAHTRPTGAAWYTVSSKLNAENLYVGYMATAATANNGWMNSTGHRANRLNSTYKSYGAAAFQGKDGAVYWVEVFSKTASVSTTYRGIDATKVDMPVTLADGTLSLKSQITNLYRTTVADTAMRVGNSYYFTLNNWNKGFTYSYTLFSRAYFTSANSAIAKIDNITGKITPVRAGVVKLYGRVSSASTLLMSREVVIRPQTVTGFSAAPKAKSVCLQWNPVAGASGFEILRSTTLSGTYTQIATVSAATTTYTNGGLSTGTAYYYKIRAYVLKPGSATRYIGYDTAAVSAVAL